jgi:hypothetical protein
MITSTGRCALAPSGPRSAAGGGSAGLSLLPDNPTPGGSGERSSIMPPHTPGRCSPGHASTAVDSHVKLGPDGRVAGLQALLLAAQAWKHASHRQLGE